MAYLLQTLVKPGLAITAQRMTLKSICFRKAYTWIKSIRTGEEVLQVFNLPETYCEFRSRVEAY